MTIFDVLFGCWHRRMSFPITNKRGTRRSEAASQTGTYVVCLDCGKEFAYSWQKMRVVPFNQERPHTAVQVEVEAEAS